MRKKLSSKTLWQLGSSTKFDQMVTTDGEQLLLCAENTRVLDLLRKPKPRQLLPDPYGIEVAIPTVANAMDTSYVGYPEKESAL